ncbi:MAG: ribose 5-phosphate isomerase B [Alphaproteobacteria bacterium]|jgi:ribose 5-phosphate isomerase B|nr:ribose 5-phosphate isomerase B [Rhodospirillaceae bacterium]MDP6405115.1 ribose 5-phosphate isomerase B [Alphaproteobacteria bacterium]MDP6624627.1 ribose 5-phosphate isomerase B [Alphaproteobacteria bacterium]|tara:strand:- start:1236 stop:1670 length:435 start_codon:yes stop_codon:yes gene_type:complete
MAATTVAIAADHAGYQLKEILKRQLEDMGYGVLDLGTNGPDSVDYPDFGQAVAQALVARQAIYGVALCGTGIGISIAANRHAEVRAALCHDALTARLSRLHNDANVLALGARVIGEEVAKDCLREFLGTAYEGGRHDRRVAKLS